MDDVGGDHPPLSRVPSHDGGVAERDVVDVEQDLVGALPIPHLVAGVAGVGQDHPDGAFRPGEAGPVRVAFAVVAGWAGDAVGGQAFGDDVDAVAGEKLGVDTSHDGGGV